MTGCFSYSMLTTTRMHSIHTVFIMHTLCILALVWCIISILLEYVCILYYELVESLLLLYYINSEN